MGSTSSLNATEIAKLEKEGYCIQDNEPSHHKFSVGLTLQQIFIIVGGACTIVTIVNIFLVWLSHLIWRSNFPQQKQLMRVVILPVIFAALSWASVYEYRLNTYLSVIPKVYESYAVACFFQFMLSVITKTENEHEREQFMADTERQTRLKHKQLHDKGSLRWYKVRSMVVFQSPLITLLGVIATEILVTVMCPTKKSGMEGKFGIQIVMFVSVISAIVSIANIYLRFKKEELKQAKIARKFLSFKGLIWLFVHQQLIMEIISFARVVKPTYYMSSADFNIGVPAFMIMCECGIFSFLFFFFLSGWSYRPSAAQGNDIEMKNHKSATYAPLSAWILAFFFPADIFVQTWRAMKTFAGLFRGSFDYTGGTGVAWNQRHHNQNTSYEPYSQKYGSEPDSEGDVFMPGRVH